MMSMLQQFIRLMRETVHEWGADNGAAIAASLAYYTIFSLSPLLIVVALFLGLVFDPNALQTTLIEGLRSIIGEGGASLVEGMIRDSQVTRGDLFGSIIWLAFVIWGASGAFAQLQTALNKIWEIKPIPGRSPLAIVQTRFFSFIIVILVGAVLFGIMLTNSLLNSFMIDNGTPALALIVRPAQFVVTVALTTVLIAAVFKLLPDAIIRWRDVLVGAAFTAVLFFIGQFAVGLYLSNATVGSVFGAAGSLTVILVWIYYSAQILLFGAEFTEVWARNHGAFIRPDADATWVNEYAAKRELKQAGKDYSGIQEAEQEKMARIEAGRARRAELARSAVHSVKSRVPARRRGKVDTRTMQPVQPDDVDAS
jgi:membrane protein